MPDTDGAARRHWLLPQEAAYRRWAARMLARRTGPNQQRATFEKMFGPDGVVYYEAALGDLIGAGIACFGGGAIALTGSPNEVGIWIMLAGVLSALMGLGRFRQALKARKVLNGGEPMFRFRPPKR